MSDTRPAPSPLRDGHLTCNELFKAYFAHLALIEELQMMLEGVLETNLWKDDGMRHYQKLTRLCNEALARSRRVIGETK